MGGNSDRRRGTTLLELTFAMAILTIVMGVLLTLSLGIGDTARLQEIKVTAVDEGRRALLGLVPRLTQAKWTTINTEDLASGVLRFRMPEDLDGNGLAVDRSNALELGAEIIVRRDIDDVNQDGVSSTQLIMVQGETVTVLANNLSPDADPELLELEDGTPVENTAGFWVEESAGRLSVTIRTEGLSRKGHMVRQRFTQLVKPRN